MLVAGPAVFLAIGLAGFAMAGAFLAYPPDHAKLLIVAIEMPVTLSIAATLALLGGRPAGAGAAAMSAATLFGLCGAALVGLGLFGLIVHPQPLRKILAFNLIGGGVFLLFGSHRAPRRRGRVWRRSGPAGAGHHRHCRRLRRDRAGAWRCCCGWLARPAARRCGRMSRRARRRATAA